MATKDKRPLFDRATHEELREIRDAYHPLLAEKERLAAAYAAGDRGLAGACNESMAALDELSAGQGALTDPVIDAAIEERDAPRLEAIIDELRPTLGGGFVIFRL